MELREAIKLVDKHVRRCGIGKRGCDCGADMDMAWQRIKTEVEKRICEHTHTEQGVCLNCLENLRSKRWLGNK